VGEAGAVAERVKVAPKPADREREVLVESAPVAAARPAAEPVIPPVQSLDQVQAQQRQNAASPSPQAAQGQTQTQSVSGFTQNEVKAREQAGDRRALLARADAAALVVTSPIPAVRWRVVDGRSVQFSMDGGKIWATQYTVDAPTLIVAGTAPTSSACWLVGQGGLVLVTKDGRTWQRVKFPEATDLAKVSATDAAAAVVVATDGRTFTTLDSGVTWTQK
jgi:hypothetical protein